MWGAMVMEDVEFIFYFLTQKNSKLFMSDDGGEM